MTPTFMYVYDDIYVPGCNVTPRDTAHALQSRRRLWRRRLLTLHRTRSSLLFTFQSQQVPPATGLLLTATWRVS